MRFIDIKTGSNIDSIPHGMLVTEKRAERICDIVEDYIDNCKRDGNVNVFDLINIFNDRDRYDIKEFLYAMFVIGMTVEYSTDEYPDDLIDFVNGLS
jgi:hypothetical protein